MVIHFWYQNALNLHIRILWGLIDAKSIPQDPPERTLRLFNNQLSGIGSESALEEIAVNGQPLIDPSLVLIGDSAWSTSRARFSSQMKFVEEHSLQYMQSCLAKFGLSRWSPDLRQSPYSLYNAACRIVALDTFKQTLVAQTYAHLKPNIKYVNDMNLLKKLYDHIVHFYLDARYRKNARKPGSVEASDEASPLYKARKRVRYIFFNNSTSLMPS